MTITFVTALLNLHEDRPNEKTVEKYLSLLHTLASANIRLHVFASPDYAEKIHVKNGIVETIEIDSLKAYKESPNELLIQRTNTKDTRNYMVLMNSKVELVKRAIDSGKHSSTHFAWIDAGICHVFKDVSRTLEYLSLLNYYELPSTCMFVPGCTGQSHGRFDIIDWRFCGGFFLGDSASINAFYGFYERLYASLQKLTWEVNVWAYFESVGWKPNWYSANHDDSIVHLPIQQSIIRVPANVYIYWFGELSKCYSRGSIEAYVNESIRRRTTVLFSSTDSINESRYNDLKLITTRSIVVGLCTRNFWKNDILLLPLDDETFQHGLRSTLSKYRRVPWESKQSTVFWRGGTSGEEGITPRARVVDALFSNPYCDVRFTRGANDNSDARISPEKFAPHRVSIEDHFKYKYIMIVDGNVIASSHQWVFGSGSVPIMVTHPDNRYWFQHFLQPMKNYVPIAYDLSDLDEKIEWLVTHEKEARQIAENAMYLANTLFSSEFQKAYVDLQIKHILENARSTIGVVIPCHKPYIPYLRECLDSIQSQTVKPSKVIVVCSSSLPEDIPEDYKNYSFPLEIITREDERNQAQNRNQGASRIGTDYVSFFDADDVMHPQRLETILDNVFEDDIILHSYQTSGPSFDPIFEPVVHKNTLTRSPTGCAVFKTDWNVLIHHSQVTVRKEVLSRVMFREEEEFKRREDSLFCGDILALNDIRSLYISETLSWYRIR